MGISTLYLTDYEAGLHCIALENNPEFAAIATTVLKEARNPIDLRVGCYTQLLPKALSDLDSVDFVYFNTRSEEQNNEQLFSMCMEAVSDQTIFVFDGIKSSGQMRKFWKTVRQDPRVRVTVDLYSMGLVFFDKRLYKRDYIVYF